MIMKLYIETYGCAANKADENIVRTVLKDDSFVKSPKSADLIIILSCGVKGSTENKILNRLEELRDKKVIVGGCLPKILGKKMRERFPNFSMIGPDQIADIQNIIGRVMNNETVVELSEKVCSHIVADVKNRVQAIAICNGCLSECFYCATKIAKGRLKSHSIEAIVCSVRKAAENGAKKILLTAQDTGIYGLDIGTNLPELLKAIVTLKGDFKIRIGMMNPKYALRYVDDLIDIYKNPKIIKFIHIPVQAGSDEILKKMNRNYTADEFTKLIKKLRAEIPKLILSTDIICGFPEETEEDFQKTINLVKEIKPEVINISKFYPRPGTKAAAMKQLTTNVIKERSRRISELVKVMRRFNKQITV